MGSAGDAETVVETGGPEPMVGETGPTGDHGDKEEGDRVSRREGIDGESHAAGGWWEDDAGPVPSG